MEGVNEGSNVVYIVGYAILAYWVISNLRKK